LFYVTIGFIYWKSALTFYIKESADPFHYREQACDSLYYLMEQSAHKAPTPLVIACS